MKKQVCLLTAIVVVLFSNAQSSKKLAALEDKIFDTIWKLPEVIQQEKLVRKLSQNRRHLGVVLYDKPRRNSNYYWVKVWEDNRSGYVTYFNFYVYPKTLTIKFYDIAEDKLLGLPAWRKLQKINSKH